MALWYRCIEQIASDKPGLLSIADLIALNGNKDPRGVITEQAIQQRLGEEKTAEIVALARSDAYVHLW